MGQQEATEALLDQAAAELGSCERSAAAARAEEEAALALALARAAEAQAEAEAEASREVGRLRELLEQRTEQLLAAEEEARRHSARGEAEVAWCGSLKECVDNKASLVEDAAASTDGDGDGPS